MRWRFVVQYGQVYTGPLISPFQVSGIEGSFRKTCEITMRVLRTHQQSLLAVLEAFVYDPLINWRLLQQTDVDQHRNEGRFLLAGSVLILKSR